MALQIPTFATQQEAEAWMLQEVDDPCVDNHRFAYEDEPEAMLAYTEAQESGCCGCFDRTVMVNGRMALIGCNYGH